jgi:hypothetical protein
MLDDLNFFANGRRPQICLYMEEKWKTTSTVLKWKINGKQPELILKNLKTTESFQNARKQS